jgi:protein phosphatase
LTSWAEGPLIRPGPVLRPAGRPQRVVEKAVEVSWLSRFSGWLRRVRDEALGRSGSGAPPGGEFEETADFAAPSSLTLLPGILRLRVGVVSTVGNYREHNEDNFYVPGRRSIVEGGSTESTGEMAASTIDIAAGRRGDSLPPSSAGDPGASPPGIPLFIVADGMGGQQAGEEASRMAIEIIPRAVTRRLPGEEGEAKAVQLAIRDAVAEANQEILGSSGTVTEYSNMGTTVVLLLFRGAKVFVAGIGDSRAYRLRGGRLEQLTKDHSLADALLEAGTITKEELGNHKFKNILYLYLGSKDARGGPEDVRVLDVRPADRFLLASDGLTGVVNDDEILQVLEEYDDPQRAAKVLKDLAIAHDSKDNVTCLVVHVISEAPPAKDGPA